MSNIRVRVRNPEAIRAKLRPEQGILVGTDTTYLYDPNLIIDAVEDARDWAIKTDGLVDEEDYSSKAWAIGGTGTETNNSKYWAEQSATSATSASNSATSASSSALNAGNSATIATTQAGIATTQAGIATTKASEAASSASTATTQAGIATTKAGEAATSATNASNSATNAYNSATSAASSAVNAGDSANIAGVHATNASNSADLAKQWAIGEPTEPSGNSAKYWAEEADTSETNAEIWAEGTDEEVQALGGVHSSKGWANQSAQGQVQSDWTEADPTSKAYILNKPTIPTVNNATLTIQKNGTTVNTFTANASSNVTANITVPTNTNELTNGAGFITGITSGDVTTALGYTPANDSNVVKTSGAQTINDIKTFTGNQKLRGNTLKRVNVARGSTPASNQSANIYMTDFTEHNGDNNAFGMIRTQVDTSGNVQSFISAFKNVTAGTNYNINLVAEYNASEYKIRLGGNPLNTDTNGSLSTVTSSTASNTIPTMGWVNNPNTSINVVHRSGNETIAGTKTFTSNIDRKFSTTTDSANHYNVAITCRDSSSKITGYFRNVYYSDNSISTGVQTVRKVNGVDTYAQLEVVITDDGTAYATAPTPATSDNSTKIATTAFVNNYITANTSSVHVVVETYKSGSSWYRIYDDGWIEQGGWKSGFSSANTFENVTLHKAFADTYYNVQVSGGGSATTIYNYKIGSSATNTTTAFKLLASNTGAACFWYACGMGA